MTEVAHDRIAAALRYGRGARLVAVLVPPSIPLLTATSELRRYLRWRGIDTHPVRVEAHTDLLESVETAVESKPSDVLVVHGLEALSKTDREAYLRASSFARSRLRALSASIVLVLGTDTWSWLGMELPDLARWVDGPFVLADVGGQPGPRHLQLPFGRQLVGPDRHVLDRHRGVDVSMEAWIGRGGILVVGGPPGVGVTSLALWAETRCKELGEEIAWTEGGHIIDGVPMVGESSSARTLSDWLDQHERQRVIVERAIAEGAPQAIKNRRMTGLILGSTRMALGRPMSGIDQLYIPPVQVVDLEGGPHDPGIEVITQAMRLDLQQHLDFDLDALVPGSLLPTLGYASGGLPGLLWQLVAELEHRVRRLGFEAATPTLVHAVIEDVAHASIRPAAEEAIAHAIRYDVVDFDLEAGGSVLFYVIDDGLRTLRNPLLTVANEIRGR